MEPQRAGGGVITWIELYIWYRMHSSQINYDPIDSTKPLLREIASFKNIETETFNIKMFEFEILEHECQKFECFNTREAYVMLTGREKLRFGITSDLKV